MNRQQQGRLTIAVRNRDHMRGAEHARVTLVEYGDFECPNCKQAAPAVKLLLDRFAPDLRLVFRHFPLEEVHPQALAAAEISEVAAAQGKFWDMHDVLFERQLHLKSAQLRHYAEDLALDMARYAAEWDDHIYLQRVREDQAGGRDSGVHATPTFFVNGAIQDVSFGMHSLVERIEAILRA